MRSLKARFEQSEKMKSRGNVGSYVHLAYAVMGQNFTRDSILNNFNILIPKNEYSSDERKVLIDYLMYLSEKCAEDSQKLPKNHLERE